MEWVSKRCWYKQKKRLQSQHSSVRGGAETEKHLPEARGPASLDSLAQQQQKEELPLPQHKGRELTPRILLAPTSITHTHTQKNTTAVSFQGKPSAFELEITSREIKDTCTE